METPEERTALTAARRALDRACPALTEAELDRLWNEMVNACHEGARSGFLWGFQAGMQAALAGLTPLPPEV